MESDICCVPGCENHETDAFLKFYSLPYENKEVCKEWIRRIGEPTLYMQTITNPPQTIHKLCEIHFSYICKTGFKSELYKYSLPTLYLPTIKGVSLKTCFFSSLDSPINPLTNCLKKVIQKPTEEHKISLGVETFSEVCCICYKKGILYDIEKSFCNNKINFTSAVKCLLPEYDIASFTLPQKMCLDCSKLILTSYFTVKRIKSALKILLFTMEPLSNTSFLKRVVQVSYPKEFDMKSVLNDTKLTLNLETIKTFLPKQSIEEVEIPNYESVKPRSIDVPQPIISSPIKNELGADLFEEKSYTSKQQSAVMGTNSKELSENAYSLNTISTQTFENSAITKEISETSLSNTKTTNLETENSFSEEGNTTLKPNLKIVELDLKKTEPLTKVLYKLPSSKLLKKLTIKSKMITKESSAILKYVKQCADLEKISGKQVPPGDMVLLKAISVPKQISHMTLASIASTSQQASPKRASMIKMLPKQQLEMENIVPNLVNTFVGVLKNTELLNADKKSTTSSVKTNIILNSATRTYYDSETLNQVPNLNNTPSREIETVKSKTVGNVPTKKIKTPNVVSSSQEVLGVSNIRTENPVCSTSIEPNCPILKQYVNKRKLTNQKEKDIADNKEIIQDCNIISDFQHEHAGTSSDLPHTDDSANLCNDLKIKEECVIKTEESESINYDDSQLVDIDYADDLKPLEIGNSGEILNAVDYQRFKCSFVLGCEFTTDELPDLMEHLKKCHNRNKSVIKCSYCNVIFYGFEEYRQHLRTHKKDKRRMRKKKTSQQCFLCSHCGLAFTDKTKFRGHVRYRHTNGGMVECNTCHKKVRRFYLSEHKKNHYKRRCMECDLYFNSVKLMNQHALEYHPKQCLICSKIFRTLTGMRLHMQNHMKVDKTSGKKIECEFCYKMFKTEFGLNIHMKNRIKHNMCSGGKRQYPPGYKRKYKSQLCSICGKNVRTTLFKMHMLDHANLKRFKCDQCSYGTNKFFLLRRHQLTHSGEKPFLCTKCGDSFSQKFVLDTHSKMHEIAAQPLQCVCCEILFETRYEYRVHKRARHGIFINVGRRTRNLNRYSKHTDDNPLQTDDNSIHVRGTKFQCLQCSRIFKSSFHLRNHIIEIHDKIEGFFSCHRCPEKFNSYTSVKNHIIKQHANRTDLTCDVCEKVFPAKASLMYHMRVHTGERPHECDQCQSKFKTPGNLRSHKACIHEDKRPFPCTQCTKTFRTPQALREHVRTHTGERLTCEHCDKTFAGNSNKCKHMREIHNIRSKPIYTIETKK